MPFQKQAPGDYNAGRKPSLCPCNKVISQTSFTFTVDRFSRQSLPINEVLQISRTADNNRRPENSKVDVLMTLAFFCHTGSTLQKSDAFVFGKKKYAKTTLNIKRSV